MEEILQRILRLAPPWAREIVTVSMLVGAALTGLHNMVAPAIDRLMAGLIEPGSITVTNTALASLCLIGPVRLASYWLNSNRKPTAAVLRNISVVEAAMEQVRLRETERVTVRRSIVKALADATKQNVGQSIKPAVVFEGADQEVPGLVEGTRQS
jgi:hypothetical protein